ncbi:unnamed protein product [Vicia faba]|uniref:Uncharacterized protein n=1 Tax=Vicia faba TaxID=3906 RepID=A0AAV1BEP9_VICFA|nr:unnamed protein product [Vicia faba]
MQVNIDGKLDFVIDNIIIDEDSEFEEVEYDDEDADEDGEIDGGEYDDEDADEDCEIDGGEYDDASSSGDVGRHRYWNIDRSDGKEMFDLQNDDVLKLQFGSLGIAYEFYCWFAKMNSFAVRKGQVVKEMEMLFNKHLCVTLKDLG